MDNKTTQQETEMVNNNVRTTTNTNTTSTTKLNDNPMLKVNRVKPMVAVTFSKVEDTKS